MLYWYIYIYIYIYTYIYSFRKTERGRGERESKSDLNNSLKQSVELVAENWVMKNERMDTDAIDYRKDFIYHKQQLTDLEIN